VASKRVVVTGMGTVSPVGSNVDETWDAISAGRSGIAAITHFDTEEYKTQFAAEVKDFSPGDLLGTKLARRTDRFTQFAIVAAQQALEESGLEITDQNRERVGVVIGTGIGGVHTFFTETKTYLEKGPRRVSPFLVPMMLPDSAAGQLAILFGLQGINMAVVTACASSSNAVGEAMEIIRRGSADVVVAGGAEAAITPVAVAGFSVMSALSTRNDDPQTASRPFDLNRDGFVLGEGGAILILESEEHARARGANILAEIVGYGATNDAFHLTAPAPNGRGAAACMRIALENANLGPDDISYINAHGTSTPLNDKNETAAIKSIFGEQAYSIPVSSTKSMTGHLMGAAGALEAVICVRAIQEGILPPTINFETADPECDLDYVTGGPRSTDINYALSNSFGFGGHNASLIFHKYSVNGD
jgi:3-oxoacyl-[acyl-carrier-protein] synthase II